jgi:hypothetical protein
MISQGDVEMSLISKNFFFTFFNLFVVFTIFGTAANILQVYDEIGKQLKDVTVLLATIAKSLQNVAPFYMNLIVLQAFGLFPFRLLEFGTVFLYPITLMGSKTPRGEQTLPITPNFNLTSEQTMLSLFSPLSSIMDFTYHKLFSSSSFV